MTNPTSTPTLGDVEVRAADATSLRRRWLAGRRRDGDEATDRGIVSGHDRKRRGVRLGMGGVHLVLPPVHTPEVIHLPA